MRHYRSCTPPKTLATQQKSMTDEFDIWKTNYNKTTPVSIEAEEEKTIPTNEGSFFHLKTKSGEIKYSPSDYNNYTDFLRAVIEISIAFNSPEVDPGFRKIISLALHAFENGENVDDISDDFPSFKDYSEEEDEAYVEKAIRDAQEQAQKMEDASKFASNLPKVDQLRLQILSTEDSNVSQIDKILCKNTDLPPTTIQEALGQSVPFILPSEKAKELYVQLRMLDVALSIKAVVDEPTAIKKGVATKKATRAIKVKKSTGAKTFATSPITGYEKLKQSDGIIGKQ